MGINWAKPHHRSVPEFQLSGIPFVTSSASAEVTTSTTIKVEFPKVTRFIYVRNTSQEAIRMGFTANGVAGVSGRHYLILSGGQATERLEVKCTAVYFRGETGSGDFSL